MALQAEPAPVDDDLAAFLLGGVDPLFDPRLVLGGDHRAVVRLGIGRHADAELLDRLIELALERHERRSRLEY